MDSTTNTRAAMKMLPHSTFTSFSDLLGRAVADKIEREPGLLDIAIENIDRWTAKGVYSNPQWPTRWRVLLVEAKTDDGALGRILEILRAENEEARSWRDYSPFAGVLTSAERRIIIQQCAWNH